MGDKRKMTEKEFELIASRIRNDMRKRIEFCDNVGITLDDYYVKCCGDFEIEDMVRAFENGKLFYEEIINNYGETKEQLTTAKEIIREFVKWAIWQGNSECPSFKSIQDKAEQFLSEVEK